MKPKNSYETMATICMMIAIVTAILFDHASAYQVLIGGIGIAVALLSVGLYFYNQHTQPGDTNAATVSEDKKHDIQVPAFSTNAVRASALASDLDYQIRQYVINQERIFKRPTWRHAIDASSRSPLHNMAGYHQMFWSDALGELNKGAFSDAAEEIMLMVLRNNAGSSLEVEIDQNARVSIRRAKKTKQVKSVSNEEIDEWQKFPMPLTASARSH